MLRSDRRSFVFAFIILTVLWCAVLLVDHFTYDGHGQAPMATDSVSVSDTFPTDRPRTRRRERWYATPVQKVETFPFDPNTADSTTLLRLGLPPYMVRNIYKYRAKGGRYHEVADFKRVYGMTPELWNRISPVISIGENYRFYPQEERKKVHFTDTFAQKTDSIRELRFKDTTTWVKKFRERVELDINKADTNTLKRIPGIGSVLSRRIVRYREKLGGFSSEKQLKEIEGLPDSIGDWLKTTTGVYRKISVNKADFNTLRRHPYMSVEKTKVILYHRRVFGDLKSLDELNSYKEFTEADLKRLAPYFVFD
ncbi:MAG: helix-hairpin-helix domain-containing protein [Bacteroidaceae bacterium]|nr:helix-hairpin-helix domain-containing protein [Bacteroidaceae bacterium]